MDVIVEQALTEKIQRQQRFIDELQDELRQVRSSSIETILSQLRLREAVLLYVGQDANKFMQQIAQEFGSEVATSVSFSLFVLDNAPVPSGVRDALRTAFNHGMNRW
jgi:hypothetical protein